MGMGGQEELVDLVRVQLVAACVHGLVLRLGLQAGEVEGYCWPEQEEGVNLAFVRVRGLI